MAKEKSADRTARLFKQLASKAYLNPIAGKLLVDASDDEMIVFHKMNKVFLAHKKCTASIDNLLRADYPFVKVDGVWFVSTVKLYLYLFHARAILAAYGHKDIQDVYNAVQASSKYFDDCKKIDQKLTPRQHVNFEDYQRMQSELYKSHQLEQMRIFG